MSDPVKQLPDATYVVLVQSLYQTVLPTSIMTISFLAVGALISAQTPDRLVDSLTAIGTVIALARFANLIFHRRQATDEALEATDARRLERRFAVFYLAFALVLGLFSARAFLVSTTESHMLVIGLLFGYGAGVAAGVAFRPIIAVPCMVLAILPTVITALLTPDPSRVAAALLLLAFGGGGIASIFQRCGAATRGITMRRTFAALARADALTGLSNRLSLRERFDLFLAEAPPSEMLAVHYLDLDKFKPVNDRFGHPVGDALLRAVSERLNGVLRRGDLAARLGGDEFVILQTALAERGEAELLARRIAREIARPFAIEGHRIEIGTSVGFAFYPDHGEDLDGLIDKADKALVRMKRQGGGISAYVPFCDERPEPLRLSA